MKILVVVDNEYFNDPRVRNEVEIALKIGYDVSVLCLRYSKKQKNPDIRLEKISQFFIPKQLKNLLFGLQNSLPFYELIWAYHIKKQIKSFNPDVIHAHDLYMSKAVHQAIRGIKIPFILDLHENYPAAIKSYEYANGFPKRLLVKPAKWSRKEKKYLSYPDGIVVLSNYFNSQLVQKYNELSHKPFLVYPNVVNIGQLLSYPTISKEFKGVKSKILLYFGVVGKRRGIDVSIEAIRNLVKRNYDLKLVLIGPIDKAEKAEMQSLFNQEDVKRFLFHYPWKDISEIPKYISASYLCLSPIIKNEQHESGVANKIFQYMLFEKPIIVSNCQPQVEIVKRHRCGLDFRSGDSNDLATKIESLINNPKLAAEMGKNGKNAVLSTYNTTAYTQDFEAFYIKVATKE